MSTAWDAVVWLVGLPQRVPLIDYEGFGVAGLVLLVGLVVTGEIDVR